MIDKYKKMKVCDKCYQETDDDGEIKSNLKDTLDKVNLTNKDNIQLDKCDECDDS